MPDFMGYTLEHLGLGTLWNIATVSFHLYAHHCEFIYLMVDFDPKDSDTCIVKVIIIGNNRKAAFSSSSPPIMVSLTYFFCYY